MIGGCIAVLTMLLEGVQGGGGAGGAVEGTVAKGVIAGAGKRGVTVAANKAAGTAAQDVVGKRLVATYGANRVYPQIYTKTPTLSRTGRFSDWGVYPYAGAKEAGELPEFFVEVKAGNAVYGGLQAAKDIWILDQYGIPTYLERVNK
jgi:hypothetical protein